MPKPFSEDTQTFEERLEENSTMSSCLFHTFFLSFLDGRKPNDKYQHHISGVLRPHQDSGYDIICCVSKIVIDIAELWEYAILVKEN